MAVHILDAMSREGFEDVVALHDKRSGLKAFLAVHDTSAGPAFGGVRRFAYPTEQAALLDCLRLSLAMSWKVALADLAGGGGKVVILDHPELDLERAYRHLGTCVERLGGRFYTGPDVGTGERELAALCSTTRFATPPGPEGPGDLAGATCAGTLAGMAAVLRQLDGEEDWPRRKVVIQGLGSVGQGMARMLLERGVHVVATDLDGDRAAAAAAELEFELLDPGTEFGVEADVFCPCAMGGVLHDVTIQRLASRAVAGAANNVLAKKRHGDRLHERGILYAPDFVINSGAVIRGATFHLRGEPAGNDEIARRIGSVASEVLERAVAEARSPARVAAEEAQRRIAARRGD